MQKTSSRVVLAATTMNIQGLEALATLASTYPAPTTTATAEAKKDESPKVEQCEDPVSKQVQPAAAQQYANSQGIQTQQQTRAQPQVFTPQMWQHLMTAATGVPMPAAPTNQTMLPNMSALNQMQPLHGHQLNLHLQRLMSPQPTSNSGALPASQVQPTQPVDQTIQALSLALNGMNPGVLTGLLGPQATPATNQHLAQTMASPRAPAVSASVAVAPPPSKHTNIAPQPKASESSVDEADGDHYHHYEDKKQQKRVANRRSAQLSRKRKKLFIEELKDENDELRRKEQILRSIPDLVVVFDSSGRLWFVSESVSRFLDHGASDLEGTSFWSLLCNGSVRLLKAAFMDSLAAREGDSNTAPLGPGFWDVRLKNKDGTESPVSLNGVVHFAGDRPECVCTIRPKRDNLSKKMNTNIENVAKTLNSMNDGKSSGKTKSPYRISDSSENGSSDEVSTRA